MVKLPGSNLNVHFEEYHFMTYNAGWVTTSDPLHPNELDLGRVKSTQSGKKKPALLYSDLNLLWYIEEADSLEDLKQALLEWRENIDEIEGVDEEIGIEQEIAKQVFDGDAEDA